ncbi:DUF1192 domain-containing protein [Bartonella sp. LJL80]
MTIDESMPIRKAQHQLGQDISMLSFDELTARTALLETEIFRLKEEQNKKDKSRADAEALFKSK